MPIKNIEIKGTPKQIFKQLEPENARDWFPELYIVDEDDEHVECETLQNTGAQYLMRIKKKKRYKKLSGTIESISEPTSEQLIFEWKFKSAKFQNDAYWTQINMNYKLPNKSEYKEWWLGVVIPAMLALSESGFANMPSAYASTISQTVTNSAMVELFIAKKNVIIPLILLVTSGGSAAVLLDDQGPDIYLNYAVADTTPIDYSGTSITIENFSPKDRSGIADSGCDIYERHKIGIGEFSFNCWATDNSMFKNTSTKQFTVTVEEPDKSHWPSCVNEYLLIPEEYENRDELLNIDTYTQVQFKSIVKEYEQKSERLVASGEHNNARIEASILLDRINPHSYPGLSNFANAIRDENREEYGINQKRLDCAIEIHDMRQIQAKAWGTLALAEDKFLDGEYRESINLANKIIEQYDEPSPFYDTNNYANALIIRGNSYLQLLALEKAEDDYNTAIKVVEKYEIDEKFDPWFGLGIIEYRKSHFDTSVPLLEKAHSLNGLEKEVNFLLIKTWLLTDKYDKVVDLLSSVEDPKLKEYLKNTIPTYSHLIGSEV